MWRRKDKRILLFETFGVIQIGEKSETIDWAGPNWWTLAIFLTALWLVNLEPGNPVRDFLVSKDFIGAVGGGFAGLVHITTRFYAKRIREFIPKNPLDAKRANEQIKSLSNAINALGAGIAVAVTIKQLSEPTPNYELIIIATGLGVWIHTGARGLLGLLKDESVSNASPVDESITNMSRNAD